MKALRLKHSSHKAEFFPSMRIEINLGSDMETQQSLDSFLVHLKDKTDELRVCFKVKVVVAMFLKFTIKVKLTDLKDVNTSLLIEEDEAMDDINNLKHHINAVHKIIEKISRDINNETKDSVTMT